MSNFYNFMGLFLMSFIPLMVVAIGAMMSEKGGVTNIALEGIMILGAFCGVLVVKYLGKAVEMNADSSMWLIQGVYLFGMLIAAVAGILVALLHAFASINLAANQIISATAINTLAPALVVFLTMTLSLGQVRGSDEIEVPYALFRFKEMGFLSKIPFIGDLFFKDANLSVFIGIAILITSYIVLYKTRLGLRIRACGEHPEAADSVGINVYKTRYFGTLASGALAGIGGYMLITNIYTVYNGTVAGYGFLAMAVMIFGNWKPFKIALAAAFFSFLTVLASGIAYIPFLENLGFSNEVLKMLPFIATLVVLIFFSKTNQGPRANGVPYQKGGN
jgi:ABC-type uncharacterized transport system permease subunit